MDGESLKRNLAIEIYTVNRLFGESNLSQIIDNAIKLSAFVIYGVRPMKTIWLPVEPSAIKLPETFIELFHFAIEYGFQE
jgi:hypothetical protein